MTTIVVPRAETIIAQMLGFFSIVGFSSSLGFYIQYLSSEQPIWAFASIFCLILSMSCFRYTAWGHSLWMESSSVRKELRRVVWPSKMIALRMMLGVSMIACIASFVVWCMDWLLSCLM